MTLVLTDIYVILNDIDRSLNEAAPDKIRQYRSDYNNNPPNTVPFIPRMVSTSGRLHSEFVRLLILQTHRETDRFSTSAARLSFHNSKTGLVWVSLRRHLYVSTNLNIDGTPITSRTHTLPSHSQTSRLLTSSLSLGVPVPPSHPVYPSRSDPSDLVFSLSSHRHSYIDLLCISHFIDS